MFHFALQYKSYTGPKHLFLISFLVFISLNLFENIYHYSIGRQSDQRRLSWVNPTYLDWLRILWVMVFFGLLQAFLTCWVVGC